MTLNSSKPQIVFNQDQKPFHVLLTSSILRDANYLFLRKLGARILDFVLDFRNNISRIEEIAEYVKKLKMNEELSEWLLDQIKHRLLSPGVTTLNILSTYFHIVETLTIIDEDMLSFNQVTAPVKKFLLQRVDLINTILAFWKKSPSLSLNSQQQNFSFGNLNQPALVHNPSS